MDYETDIGKFVNITVKGNGADSVIKGRLEKVEVVGGIKRLLVVNPANKSKRNIIAEDSISQYYARPWSET